MLTFLYFWILMLSHCFFWNTCTRIYMKFMTFSCSWFFKSHIFLKKYSVHYTYIEPFSECLSSSALIRFRAGNRAGLGLTFFGEAADMKIKSVNVWIKINIQKTFSTKGYCAKKQNKRAIVYIVSMNLEVYHGRTRDPWPDFWLPSGLSLTHLLWPPTFHDLAEMISMYMK